MKQIIVMISMIMLGIAIAGFVGSFSVSAEHISDDTNDKIVHMTTSGAAS